MSRCPLSSVNRRDISRSPAVVAEIVEAAVELNPVITSPAAKVNAFVET